ncbi:WbqC family protein [bacterium]|nr:WbqC family protein [bacterium]
MIITTHQPIFLPWPGFFCKALHADAMVLLDDVQFPRGGTWMTRNRLKSHQGEVWLTVPVWKKGRGDQVIRNVEICYETDWRKKHLRTIHEQYANAPYIYDAFPQFEKIYAKEHLRLLDFNLEIIHFLWNAIAIKTQLLKQSDLSISGKGSSLLIDLCKRLRADEYAAFPAVEKYLDTEAFKAAGIKIKFISFSPPVYPQLWGDFRQNLSALDLILNCQPKTHNILMHASMK